MRESITTGENIMRRGTGCRAGYDQCAALFAERRFARERRREATRFDEMP